MTLDVTLTSIDVAERTLIVTNKSKKTELEFSSKSKVTIGGKPGSLEALTPGSQISITFDPEYGIVTAIESLEEVSEPSPESETTDPENSEDDGTARIIAKITEIDVENRSLTVTRKSKNSTFELSAKVNVTIDGEASSVEALQPDQLASITFIIEYDVVTTIDVNTTPPSTEDNN